MLRELKAINEKFKEITDQSIYEYNVAFLFIAMIGCMELSFLFTACAP